jgi:hypothetical protein
MKVTMKTQINASVDEVWAIVGDFNGLPKFVAAAVKSDVEGVGIGSVRTITLPDGALLTERLEEYDSNGKTLKYAILEGPLPVENYLSTMEVKSTKNGCEFEWSSQFDGKGVTDEEARAAITGVYQLGFDGLTKIFS